MYFRIASEKMFCIASDLGDPGVRFESHRTSQLHRAIWATKRGCGLSEQPDGNLVAICG